MGGGGMAGGNMGVMGMGGMGIGGMGGGGGMGMGGMSGGDMAMGGMGMGGGGMAMGGMGGVGGGPMGLMGQSLDGLSRLASNMERINVMRGGNMRGMGPGMNGNMRRSRDEFERGRDNDDGMRRRTGSAEPRGRPDMSARRANDPDAGGSVVLVSNMNQQVKHVLVQVHTQYTLILSTTYLDHALYSVICCCGWHDAC